MEKMVRSLHQDPGKARIMLLMMCMEKMRWRALSWKSTRILARPG
jgi:hypothetical protein